MFTFVKKFFNKHIAPLAPQQGYSAVKTKGYLNQFRLFNSALCSSQGVQEAVTNVNYYRFYKTHSVVYACVKLNATGSAALGIRANDEAAPELHKLLLDPNPQQTQFDFLQLCFLNHELTGNCFLIKEIVQGNLQLRVLRSENVRIVPGQYGAPVAYEYPVEGKVYSIEPKDMMHFKQCDPEQDFLGQSPLSTVSHMIAQFNAEQENDRRRADKVWRPSGVFYYNSKMPLPPAEEECFAQELTRVVKDGGQAPLFLPKDLRWEEAPERQPRINKEVFELLAKSVAQALGVPPSLVGITEPTYSNYQEARTQHLEEVVVPMVRKFAAKLSKFLRPEFGDFEIVPGGYPEVTCKTQE